MDFSRITQVKAQYHRGLILPALLAVVAWIAGAHLINANFLAPASTASVEQAAQAQAAQTAQQVRQFLQRGDQQLQGLVKQAGEQGSAKKGALRAQLFQPDTVRAGAGNPPLSFATVDLIKRTASKSRQPTEILQDTDQQQWHIYRTTLSDNNGVVLASEPFSRLERELAKLDNGAGRLSLIQQFQGGPPRALWQGGNGMPGAPRVQAPVPGSHLRLELVPSKTFVGANDISSLWLYLPAIIGLLATLWFLPMLNPREEAAPWERKGRNTEPRPSSDYPEFKKTGSHSEVWENGDSDSKPARRPAPKLPSNYPPQVFRAYDIRGLAGKEIDEPFAYQLGRALGTLALHAGETMLLVGRDGRNSSPLLAECLTQGILDTGCDTVDLGLVPSPLVYYACAKGRNTSSGVVVTASHNPAEYNGFKILLKGQSLAENKLQRLHQLMQDGPFKTGEGSNAEQSLVENYIDEVFNDVALAGQPNLVIDAGNGATSELAPQLFEQLGCDVTQLFCQVDGNFPNHAPDPSRPENLRALRDRVLETGADLGIALDGDGDRVTLVSSSGRIAWADQLVMLLARDILAREPGEDVVFDVKSSRALAELITQYGGRPVMWKTGHAPMKAKMRETNAILGGELSGHIFIRDRWFGFDDGMYAAARILEIMALREQSLDELLDSLPQLVSTPEILVPVAEEDKFALVEKLRDEGQFGDGELITLDGIRIEYPEGWGLVRASNTTAALTLRFEAETEQALETIRERVETQLKTVLPPQTAI